MRQRSHRSRSLLLPCHVPCTYTELHISSSFTDRSQTVAPRFRSLSQRSFPLLFKYPTCTTLFKKSTTFAQPGKSETEHPRAHTAQTIDTVFFRAHLSSDRGAVIVNRPAGRTSSYQMLPVSNAGLGLFPQTLMPLGSARTQPLITMSHFGPTVGATPQDKSASVPAPCAQSSSSPRASLSFLTI
jgi:hypothetical protein